MRALLLASSALLLGLASPVGAQTEPVAPPPADAPLGRLPDAVTPAAYRLDLTINPENPRFSGHVEIDATLKSPASRIWMHGHDLAVGSATARVGERVFTGHWQQVDDTGVASLSFDEPLPAGHLTLLFDYDAPFGQGPAGMFHVKVGEQWYGWSQFESIDARSAFPGFDQPSYKQPFTVTLRTQPGQMAVSNAPEIGVTRENGLDVHHFAATAPLPTYLVAMMVGPFISAEAAVPPTPQREEPLPLRIISEQTNAGQIDYALTHSQTIVRLLEDYFGQSFPYPKLDQITAPIMPGAMENAGADVYNDALLVLDESAPVEQKRNFGMVVGHELAHQWFGDLVTPVWWDDIWLNESFANWMGFRIGDAWRPDLHIAAGALAEGFAAMSTDDLVAGRPIHQPIAANSQIDAAFDSITYGKGGHVVAMVAGFMGDAKFRDGVRHYMALHRYSNATSADFFRAMAEVSGDPRLLPAMQGFTDQQGVPLLSFAGADGHYTVTQSRYARLGAQVPDTQWQVPVCARVGEQRLCQLLDGKSGVFDFSAKGALMPNAGGTGYYRFELPQAEWDRLIAASPSLEGGEAMALADSLVASYRAGRASAAQLAQLALTMSTNPDTHASDAALSGMRMLSAADMLDARAQRIWNRRINAVMAPQLAELGFEPRARAYIADAPERQQRRAQVVTALLHHGDDKALEARLVAAGQAFLGGDAEALDPVWYGVALDAVLDDAARQGRGLIEAQILLDKALASQDPVFRPAALRVLAGSGHADVARWLIHDVSDSRLRLSERLSLITGVAGNAGTRDMAYSYMRRHLKDLLGAGGGIFFASRLPQAVSGYCSASKAEAIERDFGPALKGRTAELELARAVERVRSCGVLKKARGGAVTKELAALK